MMKRIEIRILNKGVDDPYKIVNRICKNSLIEYSEIEQKFYFNSYYNGRQQIEVFYHYIEFNELFIENMAALSKEALAVAKVMSEENLEVANDSLKKIQSLIFNVLNFYDSYVEEASVFDFCADIFSKLLMRHILGNGNKRYSLAFLIWC